MQYRSFAGIVVLALLSATPALAESLGKVTCKVKSHPAVGKALAKEFVFDGTDFDVRRDEEFPTPTALVERRVNGMLFRYSFDIISNESELSLPEKVRSQPVFGAAFSGLPVYLSYHDSLSGGIQVRCVHTPH